MKNQNTEKYLYEIHSAEPYSSMFTPILASTDDEALKIARELRPNALFVQKDCYGRGPKLYLKGK